jgi:hypothetical protein
MSQTQHYPGASEQLTSTGTGNVQTATAAVSGARHVLLSVETTAARVTFDGSTPSATNGHVIPAGAIPLYLPIGRSSVLKVASSAGTSSILNITWFTS